MPRYFFTLTNGAVYPDEDGEELSGLASARESAVRYLTEMVLGHTEALWRDGAMAVTIADEARSSLLRVKVVVEDAEP